MTDAYRNRWIAVGLVWAGVVMLALWNLQTIGRIGSTREGWQVAAANRQFIDGRQQEMADIRARAERLNRPVESVAFGLLAVAEELTRLAASNGLSDIKIEGQPAEAAGDLLPLTVTFSGPLAAATRWTAAVQADYPYLVVRGMEANSAPSGSPGFKIQLNFRYRVVTS